MVISTYAATPHAAFSMHFRQLHYIIRLPSRDAAATPIAEKPDTPPRRRRRQLPPQQTRRDADEFQPPAEKKTRRPHAIRRAAASRRSASELLMPRPPSHLLRHCLS